jgi:lantibiotic biosynthesis dehydratase-like protein
MASDWYSKKLHVNSSDLMGGIVTGFIKPLISKLDEEGVDFRFHFFRYSTPTSFLRLRVRGNESVLREVEEYEQSNLGKFGGRSEAEPYNLDDALEGSPFKNADEMEQGWCICEMASRISLECAVQGVSMSRLRDHQYGIGVWLNHLFLNSVGYAVGEEYMVHRKAMYERAVVLLMSRHGISGQEALARYDANLSEFNRLIDQATAVLNQGPTSP